MLSKLSKYMSLYGAHALKVFSFVLLIPHFTNVFNKSVWGNILIIQAFVLWLQILIEYGFNLSATRSMARAKDNNDEISRLVSGVLGAKFILSCVVIVISTLVFRYVDVFSRSGTLIFWGTLFAIAQGYSPIWYFMALGKFSQYASIDFANRLIYLILCLVLVKNNNDGFLIFLFGIMTSTIANVFGVYMINREHKMRFPTLADSLEALREGFSMFFFVGLTSIYTTLNLVIMGLSQTTNVVASYGTSDRIVRAAGGLLDPLNRIIFSRLSHLYHHDFKSAVKYLLKAGLILMFFGMFIMAVGELSAEIIVKILAPNYNDSVYYLRILLIFIPVLAINNIIGLHIMIPLGMDKEFNLVFAIVSVCSVISMFFLTPIFGAFGMGVITILTEIFASIGMIYIVMKRRVLNSFEKSGETQ